MDWTNNGITDRPDTTVASRTTFNVPRDLPPSTAIAMALADLEDEPPYLPDFMLADEVNPDALDDLVTDEIHDVMVAFTMEDYIIVVQSDGRVQIQTIED